MKNCRVTRTFDKAAFIKTLYGSTEVTNPEVVSCSIVDTFVSRHKHNEWKRYGGCKIEICDFIERRYPEREIHDDLITCVAKEARRTQVLDNANYLLWFSSRHSFVSSTISNVARTHAHTRKLLTKFAKQLIDFLLTRPQVIYESVRRISNTLSKIDRRWAWWAFSLPSEIMVIKSKYDQQVNL